MKVWLIVLAVAVVAFTFGAWFGSRYLLRPSQRERELRSVAAAEAGCAEVCWQLLHALEDFGPNTVKTLCTGEVAFYYKTFQDADDTYVSFQGPLLDDIKKDLDKWTDLKQRLDEMPPQATPFRRNNLVRDATSKPK
jgi:hypothetical protein